MKEKISRDTYENRMAEFGFRNMARMELFLWDLELFLQIQKILGDRIVLKGGAAVQFYLPRECQRTSVDIDMLFYGTEDEITELLSEIGNKLGTEDGLFVFRKHIPKNPKTELPLHTYYLELSYLSGKEKGMKVREIRDTMICEFGSYSRISTPILKGKSIKKIFWPMVDVENLDEIERFLKNDLGSDNLKYFIADISLKKQIELIEIEKKLPV